MTTQQPEAMRLAEMLTADEWPGSVTLVSYAQECVTELLRQHAENGTLRTGYAAARLEIESLKAQLHAAKQINAAQFGLLAASIPGSALRASHGQASSQAAEPVEREPLTDEQSKALMQARRTAMLMTCKARVPECGEFSAIAQDLDWLCESLGIKGGQHGTE